MRFPTFLFNKKIAPAKRLPTGTPERGVGFAWNHEPFWEQCERRLALSAMPWMPWDVGPAEADLSFTNNSLHTSVNAMAPISPIDTVAPPPMEQHLAEAHSQTGWNQVHSQFGITGKGQTVAVIDSGIAFDHVALGRGYGPGFRVVGGWDFAENDARPYDDAPAGFHGTHVAGILGANDGVHLGVAPNVDLVALRVFNDTGKGELAWAESALKWVHDNRNQFENPITTVNLSLGAAWNSSSVPTWGTLEEELGQLQRDGIVVVVSAGNAFQQNKTPGLSYPAASPFVIPVSSIDAGGSLSDFSQRDARSIAAPGRGIESSVPDYFYGKDGINNDWAKANGTSMAAPYIAGASVLVREAMEMAGLENITPQSIYEHLKSTANSVWDSVTQRSYSSLDLDRAIESLVPKDSVGDSIANAQLTNIQNSWQTDGWINSLNDRDTFRFHPTQSGLISLQLGSEYVDDASFSLLKGGQESLLPIQNGKLSFSVVAGEAIGLSIGDNDSIGPYRLNWTFQASSQGGGETSPVPPTRVTDLGSVDFLEQQLSSDVRYRVTAEHTGLMSVVVDSGTRTAGSLQVFRPVIPNGTLTDSTIENNQWRVDLNVVQGQSIEFSLPNPGSSNSAVQSVKLVNLVEQQGNQLTLHGTEGSDRVTIDLRGGLSTEVAGVKYQFDAKAIATVVAHGDLNNDALSLLGSLGAEKVELRPGTSTLLGDHIQITANNYESVKFIGGGGPDRAYLYDAATDDRLNIWPNKAELTGVGYAFQVEQMDRIFVHALQGGDDQAFVFDSVGDDQLSVRPQFTSLAGAGYFNYVSGFERVFAYAPTGGVDRASLYDSAGDDLLSSSGEVTSIVGPGFSTFARGFEVVEAIASAGGIDRATIFASSSGGLSSGADYVGMQDANRTSVARYFERVETFVAGNLVSNTASHTIVQSMQAMESSLTLADSLPESIPECNVFLANCGGLVEYGTPSTPPRSPTESILQGEWITLVPDEAVGAEGVQHMSPLQLFVKESGSLELGWLDATQERQTLDEIFADLD
ncbi:MAG: S8 family serine peptidase [Pirellula sp.]